MKEKVFQVYMTLKYDLEMFLRHSPITAFLTGTC